MSEWWLHGRGIARPVKAVTAPSHGRWSAEQPDTCIWGAGGTEAAALEDLRAALTDHLEVLEDDTNLAPYLAVQRDWLRAHLGETNTPSWSASSKTVTLAIPTAMASSTGLNLRWP